MDGADADEGFKDLDESYCFIAFWFQKELGITLTGDYPVARFNVLKEEGVKYAKKLEDKKEDGKF